MKNILLLILLPLALYGQDNKATRNNIQGAWSCIYSVYDDPLIAADDMGPWGLATPDKILFENDSLFEFNYPCELADRAAFRIKNDSIFKILPGSVEQGAPDPIMNRESFPARILFEHDTLVITTESPTGYSTEKRYLRTKLDTTTVNWLKRYSVNISCLYGKWKLETAYDSGYDGNGMVDYDFPFEPQRTLIFTGNSRIDYSSRILWLKANGTARPFLIAELSSDGNHLDVQTMDWYHARWSYTLHYTKQ